MTAIDDKTSRIIVSPGDERLDTGMKVGEAMKKAAAWWNKEGRHQLRKTSNKAKIGRKFIAAGKAAAPAILIQGDDTDIIPSGILRGLEWDRLDRREKLRVINVWHFHFVKVPQIKLAPTTTQ